MFNYSFLSLQVFFAPEGEGTGETATEETNENTSTDTTDSTTPAAEALVGAGGDKATEAKPTVEASRQEGEDEQSGEDSYTPLTQADLDFAVPEGQELDQPLVDNFLSVINDQDLSNKDRTQKLISMQNDIMVKAGEAQAAAFVATNEQWANDVKADKDLGGDKLETNISNASMILDAYGDTEFRQMLTTTGLGNHISTMRFFSKLHAAIGEGHLVEGGPANASAKAPADILFAPEPSPT